jgi:hypothetical protein
MAIVVVSGAIANKHLNGGATWTRLNWLLGFKQLGFRVFFVEQIEGQNCVDSAGALTPFENSANLAYFKQVIGQFDLSGTAALIFENGEQVFGLSYDELLGIAEDAELLVNITGHLTFEPIMSRIRRKVYVDLDPGFTQFWHTAGSAGPRLDGHDFYFTVGENIGTPHCPIPMADIRWRRTRQPVVLEYWPTSNQGAHDRFTTIGSWRGPYGPATFEGKTFGLKVHEFRKFVTLPECLPQDFEIALDIHSAEQRDLTLLRKHGWRLVDPKMVARDPIAFRNYVQTSGAEFSVAQGIYVETNSGWFSDRTVRYLASGKPALVQDTGFSRNYPVGEGLISFRTLAEAIAGAESIARNYDKHCRAARALADEYFDSDNVLGQLIAEVGIAP